MGLSIENCQVIMSACYTAAIDIVRYINLHCSAISIRIPFSPLFHHWLACLVSYHLCGFFFVKFVSCHSIIFARI